MIKEKNRKLNIKLLLVAILLFVTVGYATLNTNLTINGTSKINNSTWDVHFDDVNPTPGSVEIDTDLYEAAQEAKIDPNDETKVTYNVLLSKPGDFYEFTVKAVNNGSIDAMISEITPTIKVDGVVKTGNQIPAWLGYSATYEEGNPLQVNHLLAHETSEEYRVRVEFKKDITNAQFADAVNKLITFEFKVTYVQNDNGQVVDHTYTRYTVNKVIDGNNNSIVMINQAVPEAITQYKTPEEALAAISAASNKNLPFYLKHRINNNSVKESYVEFVISNVNTPEGVTPGTYTLRGGAGDESSSENKPIYDSNIDVLEAAFGEDSEYCTDETTKYTCQLTNLKVEVNTNGIISVTDKDGASCDIHDWGFSGCVW